MKYQISERLYEKELKDLAKAEESNNYFMIMTIFSSFFALELNLLGGVIEPVYADEDVITIDVKTTTSIITSSNRYEINPPSNIINKWVENYDIAGGNMGEVPQKSSIFHNIKKIETATSSTVHRLVVTSIFFHIIKKKLQEKSYNIYDKIYKSKILIARTLSLKKELISKKISINDRLLETSLFFICYTLIAKLLYTSLITSHNSLNSLKSYDYQIFKKISLNLKSINFNNWFWGLISPLIRPT